MARGRNRVENRQLAKAAEIPSAFQPVSNSFASLGSPFDTQEDPFAVEQQVAVAPVVDVNKVIATNEYGGALKYSQLSPEDQAVVDARRASGVDFTPNAYKGATALMGAVDYGVGEQYDTPEEALTALPNYLSGLAAQRVGTDAEFNTKNFDPSEFTMAGVSPVSGVSGRAAKESAVDYLTKNNIPMSKEVNGQTRYLTTGLGSDILFDTVGEEGGLKTAGSYVDQGPIGTYSTVHVEPESALDDPFLGVVGMFLPPVALATTAMKVAAGEKLSPTEILGAVTAGLNFTDITAAPTKALPDGKGLGNLSYGDTQTLLSTAASGGNVEDLAASYLGSTAVNKAFEDIKGGERLAGIFQADDAKAALQNTVQKVVSGEKLDDALLSGLMTYVKEGGGIGGIDLPSVDVDFGMLEKVVKALVKPVQAVASAAGALVEDAGQAIGDVGSFIDDELIQPIRPALSAFDDAVVQPVGDVIEDIAQPVGDVIEDVAQVSGDVIEDVAQVTGDVVEDLAQAIGDLAPDIDLPDISLPDVNLPDVPDLPWKDLLKMFAGGMLTGAGTQVAAPSPTRTTDDLFGFKTEVGLGDVELAKLQRRYLG